MNVSHNAPSIPEAQPFLFCLFYLYMFVLCTDVVSVCHDAHRDKGHSVFSTGGFKGQDRQTDRQTAWSHVVGYGNKAASYVKLTACLLFSRGLKWNRQAGLLIRTLFPRRGFVGK